MKKYLVKAYADAEYGLKEQRVIIAAENYEKAKKLLGIGLLIITK